MRAHRLEQHEGGDKVVVVVLQRLLHALTHSLEAGKVDDGIKLLLAKQLVQQLLVTQVTLQQQGGGGGQWLVIL